MRNRRQVTLYVDVVKRLLNVLYATTLVKLKILEQRTIIACALMPDHS